MELILLTKEQVEYDKVFKGIDKAAIATDFAIATGAYFSFHSCHEHACPYWLMEDELKMYDYAHIVNYLGDIVFSKIKNTCIGLRPVINYGKEIIDINKLSNYMKGKDKIIEYGYYPKSSISLLLEEELENKYKEGVLIKTGNTYSINKYYYGGEYLEKLDEYEYKGKRYVRVLVNLYNYDNKEGILSNRHKYKNGDIVWISVDPVTWYVDLDNKLLLSENILVSGVHYHNDFIRFNDTQIYKYMNEYMAIDMFRNNNISNKEYSNVKNRMKDIRKRIKTIKER